VDRELTHLRVAVRCLPDPTPQIRRSIFDFNWMLGLSMSFATSSASAPCCSVASSVQYDERGAWARSRARSSMMLQGRCSDRSERSHRSTCNSSRWRFSQSLECDVPKALVPEPVY